MRSLSAEALGVLARWPWPGNVRELTAVNQRAVLMHDGDALAVEHLPAELIAGALEPPPPTGKGEARIATLEEVELRYMRAVLALTGGNKVRAAEHLGITRQTLAKRLGE
jgi:DNA-binding NtrC family response regulator